MDEPERQLTQVTFTQVEDRGEYWMVHTALAYDDGTATTGGFAFPKDALEWRAAEYGIDPAAIDTLLDVVLVECYMTDEECATGTTLVTAATVAEARRDHLARVAAAKLRLRITTRTKAEPEVRSFLAAKLKVPEERANELDFLRVLSDLDPEIVEIKSRVVRSNVRMAKRQEEHVKARPARPRKRRFLDMEKEVNHG